MTMSLVCTSTNTISKQEHMATPSLHVQPFIDTTKNLLYRTSFGLLLLLTACESRSTDKSNNRPSFDGTAYQPIYATNDEIVRIETQPDRTLRRPGKIYVKNNYLFVNDLGEGIHIIDNRDPTAPNKISFLRILSNYDIAVKGNYMYADNARDLVVLDIRDPLNIKVVKRIKDAIPQNNFPPYTDIWFECVDSKKGEVVGWEKVAVSSVPACFR